jgi:hypothetical protein
MASGGETGRKFPRGVDDGGRCIRRELRAMEYVGDEIGGGGGRWGVGTRALH